MSNHLREIGDMPAMRLLTKAAVRTAEAQGFRVVRQPGRGMSNNFVLTDANGRQRTLAVRTSRNRSFAFIPLAGGTRWSPLDDVDLVAISTANHPEEPTGIDVHIIEAAEVRTRLEAAYKARIAEGFKVKDGYGMWIPLDTVNSHTAVATGSGLADKFPACAHFSFSELEAAQSEGAAERHSEVETPAFERPRTVAEALLLARQLISEFTGIPLDGVKLDLRLTT